MKYLFTFIILIPTLLRAQTFKGHLQIDTLKRTAIYKLDCDDELVVSGRPMLIYEKKISDLYSNLLYEVSVYNILWGKDSIAQKCKTIYVLINSKDKLLIDNNDFFILKSLHYLVTDKEVNCEYYNLIGALPLFKSIKIEPCEIPGSMNHHIRTSLVKYSKYKEKIVRDKYEKIIIKRRKNYCHPLRSGL